MLFLVVAHVLKKDTEPLIEGVEAVHQSRENIVFYEEEGMGKTLHNIVSFEPVIEILAI